MLYSLIRAVTLYPSASTWRLNKRSIIMRLIEYGGARRDGVDRTYPGNAASPYSAKYASACLFYLIEQAVKQTNRLTVVQKERRCHPDLHIHAHNYKWRHYDHGKNLRRQVDGMQYVLGVLEVWRHTLRRWDGSNRAGRRHRKGISLGRKSSPADHTKTGRNLSRDVWPRRRGAFVFCFLVEGLDDWSLHTAQHPEAHAPASPCEGVLYVYQQSPNLD